MTVTAESAAAVIININDNHPQWPRSQEFTGEPAPRWMSVWDAAVFAHHWLKHPDHNDLIEAIIHLPLSADDFDYQAARYHRNTKPPEAMLKAHLVRMAMGMEHYKGLYKYLSQNDSLVAALGLDDLPSRSTLWKAWNRHLPSDEERISLQVIVNSLIKNARKHGVVAPSAFSPKFDVKKHSAPDPTEPAIWEYTRTKTEEVWKEVKHFISETYSIGERAENAHKKEMAWWEAHSWMGPREETFAESGVEAFKAKTDRPDDDIHGGRHHRETLKELPIDGVREYHRQTTRKIHKYAKQHSRIDRPVVCALDGTKSPALTRLSNVEGWHPDRKKCNVTDPWILGYDHSDKGQDPDIDYHFQYYGIRTTGLAFPSVLDVIPRRRGLAKFEVVDDLLRYSTDMVNMDLLVMDAEFDNRRTRATCLKHRVPFLTPAKKNNTEKGTCSDLRNQRKLVHIEKTTIDVDRGELREILPDDHRALSMDDDELEEWLTYYKFYIVQYGNVEKWERRIKEIESSYSSDRFEVHKEDVQPEFSDDTHWRKMEREFMESIGQVPPDRPASVDKRPLTQFGAEERFKEKNKPLNEKRGTDADAKLYSVWVSDHDRIAELYEAGDLTQEELFQEVERFLERYSNRWDIENGWKKKNTLRVPTYSHDQQYRFFNFMFACTLYNVWKIVDLIVKLSYSDNPGDEPMVTMDLFLTIAEQYFGLDPPPPH